MLSYKGSWFIHTNSVCGIICVQTLYFDFIFFTTWPTDRKTFWDMNSGEHCSITEVADGLPWLLLLYWNIGLNLHLVS